MKGYFILIINLKSFGVLEPCNRLEHKCFQRFQKIFNPRRELPQLVSDASGLDFLI